MIVGIYHSRHDDFAAGVNDFPIPFPYGILFQYGCDFSICDQQRDLQNLIWKYNLAVSDYFLGLRKEWSDTSYLVVRVSQVDNRILGVPGVIDVQDTFLNGAASNLVLDEYEIPMFGGVSG